MKDEHVIRSCLRTDINAKKIINDVVIQFVNPLFNLLEMQCSHHVYWRKVRLINQPLQEPFMSQGFVQACMNFL